MPCVVCSYCTLCTIIIIIIIIIIMGQYVVQCIRLHGLYLIYLVLSSVIIALVEYFLRGP